MLCPLHTGWLISALVAAVGATSQQTMLATETLAGLPAKVGKPLFRRSRVAIRSAHFLRHSFSSRNADAAALLDQLQVGELSSSANEHNNPPLHAVEPAIGTRNCCKCCHSY